MISMKLEVAYNWLRIEGYLRNGGQYCYRYAGADVTEGSGAAIVNHAAGEAGQDRTKSIRANIRGVYFMSQSSRFSVYLAAVIGAVFMASGSGLAGEVHWGYLGKEGPAYWGDLSGKFSACAEGRMQSPIDFSATASGGGGV